MSNENKHCSSEIVYAYSCYTSFRLLSVLAFVLN
jgi:hypothetical protein